VTKLVTPFRLSVATNKSTPNQSGPDLVSKKIKNARKKEGEHSKFYLTIIFFSTGYNFNFGLIFDMMIILFVHKIAPGNNEDNISCNIGRVNPFFRFCGEISLFI